MLRDLLDAPTALAALVAGLTCVTSIFGIWYLVCGCEHVRGWGVQTRCAKLRSDVVEAIVQVRGRRAPLHACNYMRACAVCRCRAFIFLCQRVCRVLPARVACRGGLLFECAPLLAKRAPPPARSACACGRATSHTTSTTTTCSTRAWCVRPRVSHAGLGVEHGDSETVRRHLVTSLVFVRFDVDPRHPARHARRCQVTIDEWVVAMAQVRRMRVPISFDMCHTYISIFVFVFACFGAMPNPRACSHPMHRRASAAGPLLGPAVARVRACAVVVGGLFGICKPLLSWAAYSAYANRCASRRYAPLLAEFDATGRVRYLEWLERCGGGQCLVSVRLGLAVRVACDGRHVFGGSGTCRSARGFVCVVRASAV